MKECFNDDFFFEKKIDRFEEYLQDMNIKSPFPDYISLTQFKNKNLFSDYNDFQIIAEYNYSDGFSKTLYNEKLNKTFVITYNKKTVDKLTKTLFLILCEKIN